MFDFMQAETSHIKTLTSAEDLSNLMRAIKRNPNLLVEGEGPAGQQPKKMFLRATPGSATQSTMALGLTIACSYGSEDGYLLATVGDTVVTYTDDTFCILPTGTSASINPLLSEDLRY